MSETRIELVPGKPRHGIYPVTLMRDGEVLFADRVDPHDPEDIDRFIRKVCGEYGTLPADELRARLRQLASPKVPGLAAEISAGGVPYFATDTGLWWRKPSRDGEVPTQLTNFTAKIVAEVVRDDGTERETVLEIEAVQGERTARRAVSSRQFGSMTWPMELLGPEAIVYPGSLIRDHARTAIQMLSPKPIAQRTIYTHTGWRQIGHDWVYLHAPGAIGARGNVEGVQSELPPSLAEYILPRPPEGDALRDAVSATLARLKLAPEAIAFPALIAPFRAVIAPADFGLHFSGPTGVFKSELAALIQQHFGIGLDARHLPGSWQSTDNAIEGLLFAAKDAITVVDDFAPCGGPHEVARWHQRADRIFRGQGNNAGRGRMRSDASLRPPKPPRGLVVSTGEEIPIGQSLRARMLILEISQGDIPRDELTQCQRDARAGLYAAAMAGFVRWLAIRYEQVSKSFRADVEELRLQAATSGGHRRTPEIVANMAIALRYLIEFAQYAGAIDDAQGRKLWSCGWAALLESASRQSEHQIASEPAERFIQLIASAMVSGHAHLAGRDGNVPENPSAFGWRRVGTGSSGDQWQSQGDRIGWIDAEGIYLDPDASYRVAQQMAGPSNGLPIAPRTLRKRLDEKGLLIREMKKDTLTVRRQCEGAQRKVVSIRREVLCPKADIPDNHGGYRELTVGDGGGGHARMSEKLADTSGDLAFDAARPTSQSAQIGGNGANVRNVRNA